MLGIRHRTPRRSSASVAGLALSGVTGLVLLAGCSAQAGKAAWNGGDAERTSASVTAPQDGATGVPTAPELTVHTDRATGTTVALVDAAGKAVPGGTRGDGSAWVPAQQLSYGTKYTATVTATGAGGQKVTGTSTFTTMAKPANLAAAHSFLGDKQVVGVAAPIVLTFDHPVATDQRPAVEKRLFVTASPAQEGSWYWFSDKEVHYRPSEHWQPGSTVALRAALGGVSFGGGWYGRSDLTLSLSVVTEPLEITVDDTTKTLTVTRNGTVVKTMPASLGKDSTPSSSGNMVVMTRQPEAIFDSSTYGVPVDSPEGYRETVYFPLRLTWGGQFIHSAPWSVDAQGRDNVSHGCTNIAPDNAQWLYNAGHVGDPVTVLHTKRSLTWGDGWTDWDRDWSAYQQGSALPAGYDETAPTN
jgi:lipoprotein-anchoring transpeptidase ErfK/SrfK